MGGRTIGARGPRPAWCAPSEWEGRRDASGGRAAAVAELLAARWWLIPADLAVFDHLDALAFLGDRAQDGRN